MFKRRKLLLIAISMLLAMSLLVGCSREEGKQATNTSDSENNKVKVLRLAESKITTLNPHIYTQGSESRSLRYMCGSLIRIIMNDNGDGAEFFPSHAIELPNMSEDGLVWTIKLRDNLKFDDGTPIDADTYEYSWKMLLNPKLVNRNATVFFDSIPVVNAKSYWQGEEDINWEDVGLKALDEKTLQITLKKAIPTVDFLNAIVEVSTSPVHKELYNSNMNEDKTETKYGTSVKTTPKSSGGSFVLKEWTRDMIRVFEKNPDSPLANVFTPDRIEERVVENSETRLQLFEKGEIDEVLLLGAKYDRFVEDPRVKFAPAATAFTLVLNKDSEENQSLANIDFRKALFFGMNRESIGKDVYRTGKAANYIVTHAYVSNFETGQRYRDTAAAQKVVDAFPAFAPDLAKKHFNAAYEANGKQKIVFEINYFDTNENVKKIAEILEEEYENMFGKDKIDVVLAAIPWQVQYENMRKGNFQAGFSFSSAGGFAPFDLMIGFTSDHPGKINSYKNAEFDKLYERATIGDLIFDNEKRTEALAELELMLLEDFSVLPISEIQIPIMHSDKIKLNTKDGKSIPGIGFALLQADIEGEELNN